MTVIYKDTITQADGSRIIKFAMEVTDVGGVLRCNCVRGKNRTWCDHLQKAMTEALDKDSLPIDRGDEPTATHATIPVQPSKDFHVNVRLTPLHKSGMVIVTHDYVDPETDERVGVELGCLQAGMEGRAAIRYWIISWLDSMSGSHLYCQSPVHTRLPFSKGRPGIRNRDEYADAYSIITTRNCSLCVQYSDYDDDVPEI